MEDLAAVFAASLEVMQVPMTLYGFTFSWWDVLIWGTLATVVGTLIVRFLWK